MIDAAFPHHRLPKALLRKLAFQRARCDHDVLRGAMEPADKAPHELRRHGDARRDIFGKARVIGGGEGKAGIDAPAPRRKAERSLGRNMDRLGREGADTPCDGALAREGQADLAIGRAGDRNRSGEITPTTCPCARNSAMVACSVRTTPLTCGSQASVTINIRMRRSRGLGGSG